MLDLMQWQAAQFGRTLVAAGRTSIELATIGERLPFTINKTTAAEMLDLHGHQIVDGLHSRRDQRGPLIVLDMDGTVARKDAGHDNTIGNNLSNSRAIHAVKAAIRGEGSSRRPGIVAINTGNKALLQIQRILAGFGPEEAGLLERMLLVAQGGSVAYRFRARGVSVCVERVAQWDSWHDTLKQDLDRLPVEDRGHTPLYVDDELGGNESRYPGQLQVHVPSHQTNKSLVRLHSQRIVVESHLPQDSGTGAAISSFLALQSLVSEVTPDLQAQAMRLATRKSWMSRTLHPDPTQSHASDGALPEH
eukprot:TRINITY_DN6885_c0_g1_i1.p1 TRINITY_DN6885_c0_g1~~TRINITY_DN6885_c0_g1_i1.p1  ORF type:complete len:305 (+),score=51.21 TRINITY_DN6885_c0_g1_i1:229-1143(+)